MTRLVTQRIEPTAALPYLHAVVAVLFAVPLGVIACLRAGFGGFRPGRDGYSVMGFSVPVFVLAWADPAVLFRPRMASGTGLQAALGGIWEGPRDLVLPTLALGMVYMALIARITRASMLDVLAQDYVRTARAKGARDRARCCSATR